MKLTRILALCLASLTVLSLFAACKDDTSSPSTTAPSVQSDLGQTTPRITVYAPQAITTRSTSQQNPEFPIDTFPTNHGFYEGGLLADTDRLLADMDWVVLNDYLEVVWCNEGDIADYAPLFDGDQSTVYDKDNSYTLKLASKDRKALSVHGMIVTWSNHAHDANGSYELGNAEDTPQSLFMSDYYVPHIGTYPFTDDRIFINIPTNTVNFELDWDMVIDISGDQSFDLSIFMYEADNPTVDIVLYGTVG